MGDLKNNSGKFKSLGSFILAGSLSFLVGGYLGLNLGYRFGKDAGKTEIVEIYERNNGLIEEFNEILDEKRNKGLSSLETLRSLASIIREHNYLNLEYTTKAYFPSSSDLKWESFIKNDGKLETIILKGVNPYNKEVFVLEEIKIFPYKNNKILERDFYFKVNVIENCEKSKDSQSEICFSLEGKNYCFCPKTHYYFYSSGSGLYEIDKEEFLKKQAELKSRFEN